MALNFTKMHGLGNDYVYVGTFDQTVENPAELAQRISDRHRGVGSDGLILVCPPTTPGAHVRMEMYNSDGSRSEMCGNGIRCVAKLAYERGWAQHDPLRVQTDAGVLTLELTFDEARRVESVRVDMGEPVLTPRRIPVAFDGERAIDIPVSLGDVELLATCVSMGNPHAVFFVDELDRVPLRDWGPRIERHPLFPARVNAHFAQVISRDRVRMATWERGAGATQACGTGACAVCVAGALTVRTDRLLHTTLPGGDLLLEWSEANNHVYKTGPATEVFCGVWLG